ncbi:GNAT family N-acetyltransferase [Flavimarina sp. Hel_I_48]|uniref:GNAT family N-acetyltransferase n=1 Tax=Flavimarina sp. Hel_I_48 TaxID=1392488 RepID=UPI0004DF8071|nr:GNAT family N-acetyltransferase [Flavimarina sp. Hel_I_48]
MSSDSLAGTRLILKPITLEDVSEIHKLHTLPETDRYNTLGIPKDLAETEKIIKEWIGGKALPDPHNHVFKIILREKEEFIGLIALNPGKKKFKKAELWYKLHVDYWGKGYATEAVKTILDLGFGALGLHRIEAGCAVNNTGSIRVLEKAGMIREGRKRKVLPLKEGWSDTYEYAILDTDKC